MVSVQCRFFYSVIDSECNITPALAENTMLYFITVLQEDALTDSPVFIFGSALHHFSPGLVLLIEC